MLAHAFCNSLGFPDFGDALERPRVLSVYVVGLSSYLAALYLVPPFAAAPFRW